MITMEQTSEDCREEFKDMYNEFQKNLGLLKRNMEQMTPEMQTQYARQLKKLKQKIIDAAMEIGKRNMVRGLPVASVKDAEDVGRMIEWITVKDCNRTAKYAANVLFATYDIWKFLDVLEILRLQILYDGYGPYWLSKCEATGDPEYPYRNSLIGGKIWNAEFKIWESEDGLSITRMYPPTRELLAKEYKQEWIDAQERLKDLRQYAA